MSEESKRPLEGEELARAIADSCYEKKGFDIQILHVSDALGVTDYFVVCSANTTRQCRIIAEHCDKLVKDSGGFRSAPMEGLEEGNWICGDFGDVVLHVFIEPTRRYYDLETTWGDVPRIEWEPSPGIVPEPDREEFSY